MEGPDLNSIDQRIGIAMSHSYVRLASCERFSLLHGRVKRCLPISPD